MYGIADTDLCKSLYGEDQFWYKYWTKFIKNNDDVQSKCLNTLGVSCERISQSNCINTANVRSIDRCILIFSDKTYSRTLQFSYGI